MSTPATPFASTQPQAVTPGKGNKHSGHTPKKENDMSEASTGLVIEKGVPVPAARIRGHAALLRSMEVGDSFVIPAAKRACFACIFSRFKPSEFTTRSVGEGQVRVWRTA